ncbi:MAG: FecR domain-containing protein [Thermoflavifilum sp.]|nr:FecR domain-containing protein [Thermoflavifilum sp.]
MEQQLIREIIRKFLDGTCNDEEFAYLLSWYESFDEAEDMQLTEEEKKQLEEKIFNNILKNIPAWQHAYPEKKNVSRRRWHRYAWAAVITGCLAGIGWWTVKQVHEVMYVNTHSTVASNEISITNMTQRLYEVILADSTKVWLSPNSTLRYPDKFIGKQREVNLKGEAFFEVTHDPQHPFVIYSPTLITKVWGTSFLVKAFDGAPAEVSVLTGKVSVQKRDAADGIVMLYPHQKAVLSIDGELRKEKAADLPALQRWERVNLSFDNASLSEVIASLEKHFHVQINCSDAALLRYTLTGDFNEQHLSDVLALIEKSLNIRYQMINDSTIELHRIDDGSP